MLAASVQGELPAKITLSPVSVGAGQAVAMAVTLTNADGLLAGDLMVRFDPNLITPIRAEKTAASADFLIASSLTPGRLAVSLAMSRPATGLTGAIAQLWFEVRADAPAVSVPVTWSKAELFGAGLVPFDAEMVSGTITVTSPGQPANSFAQIIRQQPAEVLL